MSIPYMPLYVTDYEGDTTHLSIEEDGAYFRLLRLCWRSPGCSIPSDPKWIARQMRVDIDTFERLIEPLIGEFFKSQKGRVFHKRQQEIFDEIISTSKKRSNAGKKGGRPSKSLETNKTDESQVKAGTKHPEPKPYPEPKEEASKEDADENSYFKVGKRIGEIMGVHDDPRWFGNYALVEAWMGAGYDPDKDIIPVIKSVMKRRGDKPPPGSLKYFQTPIEETYRERTAGMKKVVTPHGFVLKPGTRQWDAWHAHKITVGEPVGFMEKAECYTVPTEYPPSAQAVNKIPNEARKAGA